MDDLGFTLEDTRRLETRICELEAELDSVTKRKDEREHAVRQYETWLREARRDRDEARAALDEAQKAWVADADLKNRIRELEAERDALREAILGTVMGASNGELPDTDYLARVLRDTAPKTEGGK